MGHLSKCHSVQFHPKSTISLEASVLANVATAAAD